MRDDFLDNARRELFPKLKASAMSVMILGDPDPKLCLELGASILFDKPLLVIALRGRPVPLALRTIANKIVEVDDVRGEAGRAAISRAIGEMRETLRFRGGEH